MIYDPINYSSSSAGGQYFGTLGINYNAASVLINGTDRRLANGQPIYCDQ